jgi:CRISPR-associated endonuclease Cas1
LAATRFLTDIGADLIHLDPQGRMLITTGRLGFHNARLRRAQAGAMSHPVGIEIARYLLGLKITGQRRVAERLPASEKALVEIDQACGALTDARSLDACTRAEAAAAGAYWEGWRDVEVGFSSADRGRVPGHWLRFGTRRSPISGRNRLAANPANALANLLYSLADAEIRIALRAVGLDPAVGIIHADTPARDSMIYDVIEAIRPLIDEFLLDLLEGHTLRAGDFGETRRGVCRVLPPLTHALAATTLTWADHAAPVVEQVARMLGDSDLRISRIPTPLTQTNRRSTSEPTVRAAGLPQRNCRECGLPLQGQGSYCSDCRTRVNAESIRNVQSEAVAVLAEARAAGRDPAHGGDAAAKRGAATARQLGESVEWDRTNERPDPEVFVTEILPGLQEVPLRVMAEATGLSVPYCSVIRRGLQTPHPRHWEALRTIGIDDE